MKIIKLILFLFIFTQSYSQSNSINEVTIKMVAPTYGFLGRDSLKYFNMFYSNHGLKTTITDDTCFFSVLQYELLNLKSCNPFFMHSWIKIEIKYENANLDTLYMNYFCIGYYYNNNSMQYSKSFTNLIYKKIIEQKETNKFISVGKGHINEDKYRNHIYQEIKRLRCKCNYNK